jgi:hypothetical protein
MRFTSFILSLLVSMLGVNAHEGHQGFYKLEVENGTLILTAKLELPDLRKAVDDSQTCASDQDLNFCAGIWLMDQISVSIDGMTRSLTLESSLTEEGHLILTYSLGAEPLDFKQIDIQNTAFTSSFEHYENVVEIELNNEQQGYKLTETRTSISHKPNSTK